MCMALQRQFDHPAPDIHNLIASLCVVSVPLFVYWYDNCDRCFTLMM